MRLPARPPHTARFGRPAATPYRRRGAPPGGRSSVLLPLGQGARALARLGVAGHRERAAPGMVRDQYGPRTAPVKKRVSSSEAGSMPA